jgi:hypothetical protein
MPQSVDIIADQLFKIIKGYGHSIVLFTDDGKKTTNPEETRRFYAKDIQMMVNFVVDKNTNEIVVNLSTGTDISTIRPMLSAIRTLANRYIIEYTVKTFGKSIQPRDFAYQAKNAPDSNVTEGFSGWSGSARKSVNELGSARIVVKHRKSVDVDKRGSRTRQIESIFIENADGERFKFPNKNITAAKAMARHVKEGGNPHDSFGQHIYAIMEELSQLKTFQRKNKRNDFFEDVNITEEITSHYTRLRHNLKSMAGPKGYASQFESFDTDPTNVSQSRLDELKSSVTVSYFDESIAGSLPYVARIIETMKDRHSNETAIVEFARAVMNSTDVPLSESCGDDTDPSSPSAQDYIDPSHRVMEWAAFLAPKMQNETMSSQLTQIAETIASVSPRHVAMAQSAINVIKQNGTVSEAKSIATKKDDYAAGEIAEITETFTKYNVRNIFGS